MGNKAATLPRIFFQQTRDRRHKIALRRKEFGIWNRVIRLRFSATTGPNGSCAMWPPWRSAV